MFTHRLQSLLLHKVMCKVKKNTIIIYQIEEMMVNKFNCNIKSECSVYVVTCKKFVFLKY